jgi:DNA-binding MarR family transcriptional regulator
MKLTPAPRRILERIAKQSGTILELQITASGGREPGILNSLIRAGYVRRIEHPTVKNGGWPADGLEITDEGRAALQEGRL